MDHLDRTIVDLGGKPTLGGNNPPAAEVLQDQVDALVSSLPGENSAILIRKDQLLEAAARMPDVVRDDEAAGKFADMTKLIAACIKNAEAARISRKEIFLASGRAVDGFFKKTVTDPLLAGKSSIEQRLGVYLRAKAARELAIRQEAERAARAAEQAASLAAAEAERAARDAASLDAAIAAEEAARQAAAASQAAARAVAETPAAMSRTRGDIGALGTLRQHWTGEVVDRETLNLGPLRAHLSLDDLNKAVRAYVKAGGRFLDGAKIYEAQDVSVR